MTRIFNLYLDESGDFDKDLDKEHENECIIGGILMNAEDVPSERNLEKKWIEEWKSVFPEYSHITRKESLNILNHATELERSIKAKTVFVSLNLFSKYGRFVIFENYEKCRIINSTITYANILSEGIIQLLIHLALENSGNKVKLNILAGGRRDMESDTVEYIDLTELKTRVEERLRLLEIKNESLKAMGATYSISIGNDKRVPYLIMCDYICHFYFRRNSTLYKSGLSDDGKPYCDVLLDLYNPKYIYSLKGNAEKDIIAAYITNEAYSSLLLDIATGLTLDDNKSRTTFLTL